MANEKKRKKELTREVERAGCECVEINKRKAGHFAVMIKTPAGAIKTVFTGTTPGDRRGLLNFRQDVRRVALA